MSIKAPGNKTRDSDNDKVKWHDHLHSSLLLSVCCLLQLLYSIPDGTMGVVILEFTNKLHLTESLMGAITASQFGISFVGAMPAGILINYFGCRPVVFVGSLLVMTGYIASAYVKTFPILLITYGVITGLGLSCFQMASIYTIQMHFDKHRALAQGFSIAGQSFGQFIWSPFAEFLFRFYGWRGAFFIIGGIQLNGCVLAMLLPPKMDTQTQNTDNTEHENKQLEKNKTIHISYIDEVQNDGLQQIKDTSQSNLHVSNNQDESAEKSCNNTLYLLRNPSFMIFCFSFMLNMFGHILPFMWLPSLGAKTGASDQSAAFLVSITAISSAVFRIVWGALADLPKLCDNRSLLLSVGCIVAGISSVTAPNMDTYTLLTVYAVIHGFAAGCYVSIACTACVDIAGKEHTALANSFLLITIGGVSLGASPFSGWLVEISGSTDLTMIVGGSSQIAAGLLLIASELVTKQSRKYSYDIE